MKFLKKNQSNKDYYKIIIIIFVFYFIFSIVKSFKSSLFLNQPDRLNLLIYGQETRYFSFGLDDRVNYYIYFVPDINIIVPGGYGKYRVGALGKLISLEKKPNLLQKSFSLTTSTFTDYYFYPKTNKIYYGKKVENNIVLPSIKEVFLNYSNASFFDRVYLSLLILKTDKSDYKALNLFKQTGQKNNDFPVKKFFKIHEGSFYQKTYRKERRDVQIMYTKSYKNGLYLNRILEGQGIRVVDLSLKKSKSNSSCLVIEGSKYFSKTARGIAKFLNCRLKKDQTSISDIIVVLNRAEKEWGIE